MIPQVLWSFSKILTAIYILVAVTEVQATPSDLTDASHDLIESIRANRHRDFASLLRDHPKLDLMASVDGKSFLWHLMDPVLDWTAERRAMSEILISREPEIVNVRLDAFPHFIIGRLLFLYDDAVRKGQNSIATAIANRLRFLFDKGYSVVDGTMHQVALPHFLLNQSKFEAVKFLTKGLIPLNGFYDWKLSPWSVQESVTLLGGQVRWALAEDDPEKTGIHLRNIELLLQRNADAKVPGTKGQSDGLYARVFSEWLYSYSREDSGDELLFRDKAAKIIELFVRHGLSLSLPVRHEEPTFASEFSTAGHDQSMLTAAVSLGLEPLVRRLIALGADVNFVAPNGRTPLITAVEKKNFELVKLLYEFGADVNGRGADETLPTPLHQAVASLRYDGDLKSTIDLIELLIGMGADMRYAETLQSFSQSISMLKPKRRLGRVMFAADKSMAQDFASLRGFLSSDRLINLINQSRDVRRAVRLLHRHHSSSGSADLVSCVQMILGGNYAIAD